MILSGSLQVRVAAVGKGTGAVLEAHSPSCAVSFIPSQVSAAIVSCLSCL